MRLVLTLALCLIGATAARAQQPISQSMAQCAGLTNALRDHITATDHLDRIDHMVRVWIEAAVSEAHLEGRDDATGWVNTHAVEMYGKWSDTSSLRMLTSQEFQDWTNYCGALSVDLGLDARMRG
ncbi:MAG: hypothetical protein AAGA87_17500 [Pseudomonadota bacterium]